MNGFNEDKKAVTKQVVIGSVAGIGITAVLFLIGYAVGRR